MVYFIFDEFCGGAQFFDTKAAWKKAMKGYDFLGKHCDDGWSEEVEYILAGFVPAGVVLFHNQDDGQETHNSEHRFYDQYATHRTRQCNIIERPEDLDDDGYSPSLGRFWDYPLEYDYICGYEFYEVAGDQ